MLVSSELCLPVTFICMGPRPRSGFLDPHFGFCWRQLCRALRRVPVLVAVPALFLSTVIALPHARAQSVTAGQLSGKVLDASTGQGVPAAIVTLEPASAGLLVDARASVMMVGVRSLVTGESGTYRFPEVVPGQYRLRIERLGYRAATLEVDVRRPVAATVSVGLELEPIALEPMRVNERAATLFQRAANRPFELDETRLGSERMRQSLFVTPDSRMLTYADVMDGVTLGEGDVFRALQRFPGVGTRDDYTAELWTRGAPWTHTRVTFDGIPLFNPVHAVGVLSAITPEVLGSVFFHPGVRPAALADGAAGVVDLRSRPGGGTGTVRAVADLSLATAKLVLDQNVAERGAWIVAARRSHLGVLTDGLGTLGLNTIDLPYVFHDVAARADLTLGRGTQLELSGLWEEDRIEGDVEGILERTTAHWGNTAARMTLRTTLGNVELSHTVGGSRFTVRTDERQVDTRERVSWTEPASRNDIEYATLATQLVPLTANQPPRWSLGYDVAWQRGRYDGPLPRYYAVRPDTTGRMQYNRDLLVAGVWGETRHHAGPITLNPAVRLETSERDFADAPRLRLAPRLALRWALSDAQSISVAAGRSWQYVQAIALAGPSIHPAFHASHFWIWPDARTPAIRSDLISVGSERWLGRSWLGSVNVFARHAIGVALPPPDTGLLGKRRPFFVNGENNARGLELNLRRISANWSASFGYTLGQSRFSVDSLDFPASADRRHAFDAMLGVRVLRDFRLAAAYTAMSGAPFTRAFVVMRTDCDDFGFGCHGPEGAHIEAPNAERTPMYAGLDVSLHWTRRLGAAELSAYLQVRNVLDRDNASTYAGSTPVQRLLRPEGVTFVRFDDRFEQGLPRLPLVGLRMTF
jgi:carboxypeptidase family protein/TonB-dependent receptor-like protein